MLNEALSEYYRCPEGFFDSRLAGPLSAEEGYFPFGGKTLYGRSCRGHGRVGSELASTALAAHRGGGQSKWPWRSYSSIPNATTRDGRLVVEFDPSEVMQNLRLERYARNASAALRTETLRQLYYLLRPLTTLAVRKRVQRFNARGWKSRSFPQWPVDTTVEHLSEMLLFMSLEATGVDKIPFVWFWPDGANGCVTMTHDVETRKGRNHCGRLMDVDEAFGIRSAFGIVPEERYTVDADFLSNIVERGFEIIVHDLNHDGRLFDNREEFLRRAKLINQYAQEFGATGFRAAVLYRKPEWFDALQISFDMSLPNVAHLDPQRGGCCTVMPFFIGDILELPVTTVQDYTLFHILDEYSIDLWKTQIDLVLKKHGFLSFLVHPDYVMEENALRIYEGLLGYLRELCSGMSIWCALPGEVNSWWRSRNKMSVVKDGHSWRIEGDDTGRAVLAYATNVDGTLRYELESPVGVPVTRNLESHRYWL